MREHDADAVVIGAGLSGLSAARRLVAHGVRVVVLEARDRVGGKTWNRALPDGVAVEGGGQWIGPDQHNVNRLVRELGLSTYPTRVDGDDLIEHDGRLTRIRQEEVVWTPEESADVANVTAALEALAAQVDPSRPWEGAGAAWDRLTYGEWAASEARTAVGRDFLRSFVAGIWATDVWEVSLLHIVTGVAAAGGSVERMNGIVGAAQQDRVVGGTQLISQRIAEELGDAVVLGAPVRRIDQSTGGVRVEADAVSVSASYAIVTCAPALAARIRYSPELSTGRDQLTQRAAMTSTIKVHAVYAEPFWRSAGLSGQLRSDGGPLALTFDNTPYGSELGVIVGFVEAGEASRFRRLDEADRRAAVVDQLVAAFGRQAAELIDYIEVDWTAQEWSRGAHQLVMAPGTWTTLGRHLREPEGRIHWAGAETATEWICYLDGAVSAGERAADEVVARLAGSAVG